MGKRHYHDPDLLEQIFFLNDRGSHIRFKQFLGASVVRVIWSEPYMMAGL